MGVESEVGYFRLNRTLLLQSFEAALKRSIMLKGT